MMRFTDSWFLVLGTSVIVACGAETTTTKVTSNGDGGTGGVAGVAGMGAVAAGGMEAFAGAGGAPESGGRSAIGGLGGGGGGGAGTGGVGGLGGVAGMGGDAGNAGQGPGTDGGAEDAGQECAVTVAVTTVTASGRYAPRNVGAVWITAGDGTFTKTLKTWGTVELRSAVAWTTASQGNVVDAVSGATRNLAGPLTATWNCTDTERQRVMPGPYAVHVTFAEDHPMQTPPAPIHEATIPIVIGAGAGAVNPPDETYFKDIHVTVQ